MKTVIISPWSKNHGEGKTNAKNYHRWPEVVMDLKTMDIHVVQIGLAGEPLVPGVDETKFGLRFAELAFLVHGCATWCSIDNFFPHFCAYHGKPGVVIWGKSDPNLFGHPMHVNLVHRDKLRPLQFGLWRDEPFDPSVFPEPRMVSTELRKILVK